MQFYFHPSVGLTISAASCGLCFATEITGSLRSPLSVIEKVSVAHLSQNASILEATSVCVLIVSLALHIHQDASSSVLARFTRHIAGAFLDVLDCTNPSPLKDLVSPLLLAPHLHVSVTVSDPSVRKFSLISLVTV